MVDYSGSFAGRLQRGFTLVEALVSSIVLTAGLLALLSFQGAVQRNNAEARAQTEAVALAEYKLNELTSFLSIDDARLSPVIAGSCPGREGRGSGLVNFVLRCDIAGAELRDVRVSVSWRDRDDRQRQAAVAARIRAVEPGRDAANLLSLVRATDTAEKSTALWPFTAVANE